LKIEKRGRASKYRSDKLQLPKGSLQQKLASLGLMVNDIGLHSMRVGFATAAANAKVPN